MMELEIIICEALKLPQDELARLASVIEAELFTLSMEENANVICN